MRPCRFDLMTSGCPGPPQPLGHGPLESLPCQHSMFNQTGPPRLGPLQRQASCQPPAARRQSPSQAASRPQVASTVNHASHIALHTLASLRTRTASPSRILPLLLDISHCCLAEHRPPLGPCCVAVSVLHYGLASNSPHRTVPTLLQSPFLRDCAQWSRDELPQVKVLPPVAACSPPPSAFALAVFPFCAHDTYASSII